MKKLFFLVFILSFLFIFPNISPLLAVYEISDFESNIEVKQNKNLRIIEKINVNFVSEHHGIYRIIPRIYSHHGKTINSRLKVISVKDEIGNSYRFQVSTKKQSVEIKIGDPDEYVVGPKVYILTYEVLNVLQKYGNNYELYWNITGHEWDEEITTASAYVTSQFAEIDKHDCYVGLLGASVGNCESSVEQNTGTFSTKTSVGYDSDFTIALSFKNPAFIEPSIGAKIANLLYDNWGYIFAPIPLYLIFYFWYKRGRDSKYSGANIYYKEEGAKVETKSVFAREHLPLVYHPISGLTPAEVGVLVDGRVDIEDVLAEIIELSRLGFLEIKKITKKKLLKDETEYAFIKTQKYGDKSERLKINNYQEYLLKEIFRSTIIHKSVEVAEKFFKESDRELDSARRSLAKREYVLLGGLRNHFYEGLPVFRDKLYERMENEELFYENPEKVRTKWISLYAVACVAFFILVMRFATLTANFGPLFALLLFSTPGFVLAFQMPRRTAKGYSLKRQIEGLSWYLEKGKWRHEIAEKQLFFEEALPLAMALGVVNSLTKDMDDIGVKPPSYVSGMSVHGLSSDFAIFKTTTASSLVSVPGGRASGSSSWSGGSGFSGGGGGGFGGGGGGGW